MLLDHYLASLSANACRIFKKAIHIVKNEEQFYAGTVDLVSKSVIGKLKICKWYFFNIF